MASSRPIDTYHATTASPTARSTQLAGDKAIISSVARVLGTSVAEIQSQLRGGKTYGQMASTRGKSADDVGKAILSGLKQILLMNASTGKMTITQVQTVLANTPEKDSPDRRRKSQRGRIEHHRSYRPIEYSGEPLDSARFPIGR